MTTLYKDGLSYLDLIYGVTMTPEWKVELKDVMTENDLHGGCTGVYGKPKSKIEDVLDTVHFFQQRIIESEWFINQLCNTASMQENDIEGIRVSLERLREAMDDRFKRIESVLERQIP